MELTGIAANCDVSVPNPATVTTAADAAVYTSFAITCEGDPPTGALMVSVTTTGADLDPDGYRVTLDDEAAWSMPVGPNDSVRFEDLMPGEHTVELTGLASNCALSSGANPRTVTVEAGAVVQISFAVYCEPLQGSLLVDVETTGDCPDPDGYMVTPDDDPAWGMAVATNGIVLFEGLAAGEHTVELSGVASNCTLEGQNPRTVWVEGGSIVRVTFRVTCHGD